MKAVRLKFPRILRDDAGTITLEASAIIPWVLLMTFIVVLFALFISQRSLLYYGSSVLSERTAFNWSNSSKVSTTGSYPEGKYDGLYWRLADDGLVQGLFGGSEGKEGIRVDVYPDMEDGVGASPEDKLKKGGFDSAAAVSLGTGEISYRNIGIKRVVETSLKSEWLPEPLAWLRGEQNAEATTSALVVEPTEFLRSFNFIRYYASKMKSSPDGEAGYQKKARNVLEKRAS